MNIRMAQEDEFVEYYIIVNPKTGERKIYVKDGQSLGTSCTDLLNYVAPGAGEMGHNHQDWASSHRPPPGVAKQKVRQT